MAGHPGNHHRPTAGPLKGQSVYLSKAQQAGLTRVQVLARLNAGDRTLIAAANTQKPAGMAKAKQTASPPVSQSQQTKPAGPPATQSQYQYIDSLLLKNKTSYIQTVASVNSSIATNGAATVGRHRISQRDEAQRVLDAWNAMTIPAGMSQKQASTLIGILKKSDELLVQALQSPAIAARLGLTQHLATDGNHAALKKLLRVI